MVDSYLTTVENISNKLTLFVHVGLYRLTSLKQGKRFYMYIYVCRLFYNDFDELHKMCICTYTLGSTQL